MSTMKGKLQRSYKRAGASGKGPTTVFVYAVTGSDEVIEQFKTIQGENYREDDDGNPLYFTTNSAGGSCDLIITRNNRIVVDMSRFDEAASLAKQYGGNLGQELARVAAEELMGSRTSSNASSSPQAAPTIPATGTRGDAGKNAPAKPAKTEVPLDKK